MQIGSEEAEPSIPSVEEVESKRKPEFNLFRSALRVIVTVIVVVPILWIIVLVTGIILGEKSRDVDIVERGTKYIDQVRISIVGTRLGANPGPGLPQGVEVSMNVTAPESGEYQIECGLYEVPEPGKYRFVFPNPPNTIKPKVISIPQSSQRGVALTKGSNLVTYLIVIPRINPTPVAINNQWSGYDSLSIDGPYKVVCNSRNFWTAIDRVMPWATLLSSPTFTITPEVAAKGGPFFATERLTEIDTFTLSKNLQKFPVYISYSTSHTTAPYRLSDFTIVNP